MIAQLKFTAFQSLPRAFFLKKKKNTEQAFDNAIPFDTLILRSISILHNTEKEI